MMLCTRVGVMTDHEVVNSLELRKTRSMKVDYASVVNCQVIRLSLLLEKIIANTNVLVPIFYCSADNPVGAHDWKYCLMEIGLGGKECSADLNCQGLKKDDY